MPTKSKLLHLLSIVAILTMILSSVNLPTASAQGRDPVQRERNAETGKVNFIGAVSGISVSFSQATGALPGAARPADPAMALARRFAPEFGLQDPEHSLSAMQTKSGEQGRVTVKYQQTYEGIPVMGGELIVNTNQNGDLYSMNGEVAQDLSLSTQPTITAEQAKAIALQAMAKWNEKSPDDFVSTEPELWIFDESLLQPSTRPAELVWRMDVTSTDGSLPLRELMLINAQTGNPDFHFNQVDASWHVQDSAGLIQDPPSTPTVLPSETPLPTETPLPQETPVPTESLSSTANEGGTSSNIVSSQVTTFSGTTWYVSVSAGNDSNVCNTPAQPCKTITQAHWLASNGDRILVAAGTYTSTSSTVASIQRSVTISGGWNEAFNDRTGKTILDGQNAGTVLSISSGTVVIDHLSIINGYYFPTYEYGGGGGVAIGAFANVTLNEVTIRNNKAKNGAGIYVSLSAPAPVVNINNSTIAGNEASTYGGAIAVSHSEGYANTYPTININNSTIADNKAWEGGGIREWFGTLHIKNSILARNTAQSSGPNCRGVNSVENTIVDDPANCSTGTGSFIVANPLLSPVLFGNQQYYSLDSTSPAIDAGNPATCLDTDQRGHSRTSDAGCDIGSYEFSENGPATQLIYISGSNQKFAPRVANEDPFTLYAADSMGDPVANVSIEFAAPATGAGGIFDDSLANTITVVTDGLGIAKPGVFRTNSELGTFSVTATATGIGTVTFSQLKNIAWYVSPAGSLSNNCQSVAAPCLTIAQAVSLAGSDETILVQNGTYQFSSRVQTNKSLKFLGGWDSSFNTQDGVSIFDGRNLNELFLFSIANNSGVPRAVLDHISLRNARSNNSGAALNVSNFHLTVRNSSILNNVSGNSGGGIISYNSTVNLENVTIKGNSATYGGAIRFEGGVLNINNSTIMQNSGSQGGGIYSNTINVINVNNSIIAENTASSGPDCLRAGSYGGIKSINYSLISSTTGCSLPAGTGNLLNVSPQPMVWKSEGYFVPSGTSPVLNAADSNTCPDFDQRYVSRPQGSGCDMGAYERKTVTGSANSMNILSGDNQRTFPGNSFSQPLKLYLLNSDGDAVAGLEATFTAPTSGPSGVFSNGQDTIQVSSDDDGVIDSGLFTSNTVHGNYDVTVTASGLSPVLFHLNNVALYVSRSGADTTDCTSPLQPCYSINYAIGQAVSGDYIFVTGETYSGALISDNLVNITNKNLTLSGGWNQSFTDQDTQTVLLLNGIGRGIYVGIGASAIIDRFDVTGGKLANNFGGGILNSGSLTFTNGAIYGNAVHGVNLNASPRISSDGGGIYSNGTDLNLINATISNNEADTGGGLLVNKGTVTLNNVTITQNFVTNIGVTAYGGGVWNQSASPLILRNSIIAGNAAEEGQDCSGSIQSAGHNIIGVNTGCTITATTGDLIGDQISPLNAGLGDLEGDENYTRTHALLAGSPAIDAADANTCATLDQRGVTRPQGATCDIGAFEGSLSGSNTAIVKTYSADNTHVSPGRFLCDQTKPDCPDGDDHAKAVHTYALQTYQLYKDIHGRNGIDNNNMPIISTVNYCGIDRYGNLVCPYYNAFWSGSQAVFGAGFGDADDVVAHELTHAVTQYESNLFYYYQSGAINESFSDLWGEYRDQTNGMGNDTNPVQVNSITGVRTVPVKWLIGEDVPEVGALRSMSDPTIFGDPDKMTSTNYNKKPYYDDYWDNGGVHTNSGINNKAAYLMVEGGTFSTKTVNALGWEKTIAIYYEAQTNLLSSAADYSDLYYALSQACRNLIGEHGILVTDCLNVQIALDAVQMNSQPVTNWTREAPACPVGMTTGASLVHFRDDFETGMDGWQSTNGVFNLDHYYASSPSTSIWGNDVWPRHNSLLTSPIISIPAGVSPFLHFKHAYGFDYYGSQYYDGGVLEYSINGGTWTDAKPLFSAGQNYNGTVFTDPDFPNDSSALHGHLGFVGDSHGYVSSQYNLASAAGKTIQFRWQLATDWSLGYAGWYIDDVQVYTCTGTPPVPALQVPANNTLITNLLPLLDWSDTAAALSYYQVQVDDDLLFYEPTINANTGIVSMYQPVTPLTANKTYYWRVRAVNGVDGTLGWSTVRSFRTAFTPPTLLAPAAGISLLSLRPTFDWEDVMETGVSGYTIQISTSSTFVPIAHTGNPILSTYTPPVDLPRGLLYWRVQTKGPNGPSAWSQVRSYQGPNPPPVPALSSPISASLVTSYTPLLRWNVVTLPVGAAPFAYYELQLDEHSDFSNPIVDDTTTLTNRLVTQYQYPTDPLVLLPLTANKTYYWRVRAATQLVVDGIRETGPWSATWSFRAAHTPPTLVSPINNYQTFNLRPTFDWNDVSETGITGYTIQISTSSTFATVAHTGNPVMSTYTPPVDLPKGLLYWRVQTKGANGPSAWSEVRSYQGPSLLLAPTLIMPTNISLSTNHTPLLKWSMVTMPAGAAPFAYYQLQIDDANDFLTPLVNDTTSLTDRLLPQSLISPALTPTTNYYWRVRVVDQLLVDGVQEMSPWSPVWNFRTAHTPPTLLTPIPGAPTFSLRPTFDWENVAENGVSGYTIQFSTTSTFTSIAHTGSPVTSTYTPPVNLPKGLLYWRVRVNGTYGPSGWSAVRSYQGPNPPAAPVLTLPANASLSTSYTPLLVWKPVVMPASAAPFAYYQVQLADNQGFSSPIVDDITITDRLVTQLSVSPDLDPNRTYYWRVRAVDQLIVDGIHETSPWSAVRSLRTAIQPPTLNLPGNVATSVSRLPLLDWEDVTGNTGYTLQVWRTGAAPVTINIPANVSQYQYMTALLPNTTYFWKVQTKAGNGPSLWSTTFSFTTGP